MYHKYPFFGVNFKIYPDTIGKKGLALAQTIESIGNEYGVNFVVTPQLPDLRLINSETSLDIVAASADAVTPGRGMGKILLETVNEAGASRVTINHVENRDTISDIAFKIERCKEIGIGSAICVDSIRMGRAIAEYDPDLFIFEKPDDISTDRAITQTHPERVEEFVEMVDSVNPRTKVLVGGGIRTAEDVRLAFELGADATGAASAISTAENPQERLTAIAEAVVDFL